MKLHHVKVFISHSWAHSGHYEKLADWVFKEDWFINGVPVIFYDYSIPEDDPIHNAANDAQLQARIFAIIKESDVIVIPTGMYSTYSKWIGKELRGAAKHRKPVLGVNPWAQKRKSTTVQKYAVETVGWSSQSVVDGIWRLFVS